MTFGDVGKRIRPTSSSCKHASKDPTVSPAPNNTLYQIRDYNRGLEAIYIDIWLTLLPRDLKAAEYFLNYNK